MTFLNPAVLFGLLAASIPVIIHLLNLRKLKKIEFSSLMFLKELQKNKIRKIKIKQWIILLLRILIIVFLVTAFARPTLESVSISGITSSVKTTAVFIIDDSFSMSLLDSKGSYFNQSKEMALGLAGLLKEGDEAVIIKTSDINYNEELLPSNPTRQINEIKQQIEKLQVSMVTGSLHKSLLRAGDILGKSKNFNKEIYILSDLQKTLFPEENLVSDLSELLNDKVKIYAVKFPEKTVKNSGIDKIKINNAIFEKNKPLSVSAFITNYSSTDMPNTIVSLFVNNERKAQRSIELKSKETKEVILESIMESEGFSNIVVRLEDDDIQDDNNIFAYIYLPSLLKTLIVTDRTEDAEFIELAIRAGDPSQMHEIDIKTTAQLSSLNLNLYNSLFIIGPDNNIKSEQIVSFLESGKGIFLSPSGISSIESFKTICNITGIQLPKSFYIQKNKNENSVTAFNTTDFEHPILSEIFIDKKRPKISSPEIFKYFSFFPGGKGKSLITLADNSSFLADYKFGLGKVVVLAVAPNLEFSSFPLKSIFAPLIYKTAYYLSSVNNSDTSYYAGNPIQLKSTLYNASQLKVTKPDNSNEVINLEDDQSKTKIVFSNTDKIGNYSFFSNNKITEVVSINHNPEESITERLSIGDFESYLKRINFKGRNYVIDTDDNISEVVKMARYGSELWKIFLILALVLAIVEMILSRNTKKEIAISSNP